MFKLTFLVLATTGLFQLATGSPMASTPARRGSNEGVYLVNCAIPSAFSYSEMDYYSNAKSGSQNGQLPNATAYVDLTESIVWEGQEICGPFNSGETFCSSIVSNGQSLATGAFAGTGFNDETQFNCFKDNGRVLYSDSDGVIYNSVYYCFDA